MPCTFTVQNIINLTEKNCVQITGTDEPRPYDIVIRCGVELQINIWLLQ